ncbi:MAG: hypothetical protein K9K88_11385 [Desulfobacterales bacterium]|nr:hypothetical protein [Desulfobacterales bacterium]
MVIEGILEENRELYRGQYDEVIGRLLHIPKGSLRTREVNHAKYWYLRRHVPGKGYEDVYVGPAGDRAAEAFVSFVQERKKRLEERDAIKRSLKALGVTKVDLQEKGYHRMFASLLDAFGSVGLWEEGLMLIGSWCFNVYVQVFGVEFYPLRTMDFDFGLRIPYRGGKADVDKLLRDLGFTAKVDPGHGKIDYVLPGVGMVEVFIDRDQADKEQVERLKRDLCLRPAAVSYLRILTDHPVTTKVHGVHKAITLPSMPAFFVHRLVTARFGEYRDPAFHAGKIRRDYKQAALVAKKIEADVDLKKELEAIIAGLPNGLYKKIREASEGAVEFVKSPDLTEENVIQIQRMALAKGNL